jgi:hypothetical protein
MSLDIKGMAQAGADLAYSLTSQVWEPVVLRTQRSGTYDAANDTWSGVTNVSIQLDALRYNSVDERVATAPGYVCNLLVRESDLGGQPFGADDTVMIDGIEHTIAHFEYEPSRTVIVLVLHKPTRTTDG